MESEGSKGWEIQLLNLASSACLGVLDPIIGLICIRLTRNEMHATRTNFSKKAAARVSMYKFYNFTFTILAAKLVAYGTSSTQNPFNT